MKCVFRYSLLSLGVWVGAALKEWCQVKILAKYQILLTTENILETATYLEMYQTLDTEDIDLFSFRLGDVVPFLNMKDHSVGK